MRLWMFLAAAGLGIGALLAAPATPHGPRGAAPGPGPRMGRCPHGMAMPGGQVGMLLRQREALGLTNEQVDRLTTLQANLRRQVVRQQADRRVAQVDLAELLRQPNPDRARVEAAVREIGRLQTEMALTHTRAMLDARNVLTEEQRERLRNLSMRAPAAGVGAPPCPRVTMSAQGVAGAVGAPCPPGEGCTPAHTGVGGGL